jgi:hypothetical protein
MDPRQNQPPGGHDDDAPIIKGRGRGSGVGRAARSAKGVAAMREVSAEIFNQSVC